MNYYISDLHLFHKNVTRAGKDLRYKQLFDEICDYKEISDTLDRKNVKLVLCHYIGGI